jgi:hypothetical protein
MYGLNTGCGIVAGLLKVQNSIWSTVKDEDVLQPYIQKVAKSGK